MLVKLLANDIAKYWDSIKEAMEATIPQDYLKTHDRYNHILDNLLMDEMQAWWVVLGNDALQKVVALIITTIFFDNVVRANALCLYCLFGYEPIPEEEWPASFLTLEKFAVSRGCVIMEAYVSAPPLIERAKSFGWNTERTHIWKDLNREIINET